MLDLCCCEDFSPVAASRGYSLIVMSRLLIAGASPVVEQGLQRALALTVAAHGLQDAGSVVVALGLSSSLACGIFPSQGLNSCLLCWQADSLLSHQGSLTHSLDYLYSFL